MQKECEQHLKGNIIIRDLPKLKNFPAQGFTKQEWAMLHDLAALNNVILHPLPREHPLLKGKLFQIDERVSAGKLKFTTIRVVEDLTREEYPELAMGLGAEPTQTLENALVSKGIESLLQIYKGEAKPKLRRIMKRISLRVIREHVREFENLLTKASEEKDITEKVDLEIKALKRLQRALGILTPVEYRGTSPQLIHSPRRILHRLEGVCSDRSILALAFIFPTLTKLNYESINVWGTDVLEDSRGLGVPHCCLTLELSDGSAFILETTLPSLSGRVPPSILPKKILSTAMKKNLNANSKSLEVELVQEVDEIQEYTRFHRRLRLYPPETFIQLEEYIILATVYSYKGMRKEAERCYLRGLEIAPEYAEAHNNLGCIYFEHGMMEKAEKHLLKALRIKPLSPESHYNLARLYEKWNKRDKAIAHYEVFLDLESKKHKHSQHFPEMEYAKEYLGRRYL